MKQSIQLVACLHSPRRAQAMIYTQVGDTHYRLHKNLRSPTLAYSVMTDRETCFIEAKKIARDQPDFAIYEDIDSAPLNQTQLEAMIHRLQAAGYLRHEQSA